MKSFVTWGWWLIGSRSDGRTHKRAATTPVKVYWLKVRFASSQMVAA